MDQESLTPLTKQVLALIKPYIDMGYSMEEAVASVEYNFTQRPWKITDDWEIFVAQYKERKQELKMAEISAQQANSKFHSLLEYRAKHSKALSFESEAHEKLHSTYHWLSRHAIIAPHFDIEYGRKIVVKNAQNEEIMLTADGESYSSFILLPLLNLVTARRALLVGGPGKGKTTSAVLMSLIAGMDHDTTRRSIQRGHPQLSVSDLLGNPLPSDMLKAERASDIKVSFRNWIQQRNHIIDEYNRIPTKTQSALLSLLAEGYAEMFDQYIHTGRSSWFLTANDDAGGGTFQVIEALKDRIDITIRAVPFYSNYLAELLSRLELNQDLDRMIPNAIIFSEKELDNIYSSILKVRVSEQVMDFLGFFSASFNFCRMASAHFEHKNKDTLRLSGRTVSDVCNENCPLDKKVHLCSQSENGLSTRSYQAMLHFAKALAYFRSQDEVKLDDIEQLIPWCLHEKLIANRRSAFFEIKGANLLLNDRVAWLRAAYINAQKQFIKYSPTKAQVKKLLSDPKSTQMAIESKIRDILSSSELSGAAYEDIISLKAEYAKRENKKHEGV
jgi:MoxR-like ATPase